MPDELIQLYQKYTPHTVEPGEPLLYQGEVPRNSFLVTDGIVKVYDIGASGDEKIVNFMSVGDIIPPAWAFKKAPVSLYYYDAFTTVTYYTIPRQELEKAIDDTPAITKYFYEHYATSYISALLEIHALEQSKGTDKIVHMLQYLLMRFPGEQQGEWHEINLRVTHQDIGNMTGLTRETTSTELSKLKKQGIVSYKNQYYSLNLPLMRSQLSSEEFLRFSY
jgi:CRP-like cAMP-binding protein